MSPHILHEFSYSLLYSSKTDAVLSEVHDQ